MKLLISLLLYLFFCAALFGQITLTATPNANWSCSGLNCSSTQRQSGHPPFPLRISITGSGTVTVGSCSTGNACSTFVPKTCNVGAPCDNSATAPNSVYFVADEYNNPVWTPGTYTASFPISGSSGGGGTVNITLTTVAYTNPTFSSYSSTINNCGTTNAQVWNPGDLPTCTGWTYAGFTMPLAGVTYVDANFGGIVKGLVNPTVSGSRFIYSDSVTNAINKDNSLVVTAQQNGNYYATSTLTGVDVYGPSNFNFNTCNAAFTWSPTIALASYNLSGGAKINKHLMNSNCSADTTVYAYSGPCAVNGCTFTNGGDG